LIEVFKNIPVRLHDEPSSGDVTRIQIRLPGKFLVFFTLDGRRIVRKFRKNDLVQVIYETIKALEAKEKSFEVINEWLT
jgi:hypothetical protein